ncbi:interleukin-1 receptor type 1-like protein [Lates japonicus]|uniref:Soluble interferon alpha/beta receptor OPG204 n=1 Tax=Lates japonicus TaxID=270547 RepID=A0AAD3M3E8_LATJO|nr:interleukin-1 receptor type 1-like protein [Lates japonicus]
MKLSSVVKAFGSLCLLLADGLPVDEDRAPKIIAPDHNKIKTRPGKQLFLPCDAFTKSEDDATLIYWLVNDSFPEDLPSSDRIVEEEKSTLKDGAIRRRLQLKNVTSEDFKSSFTCVVMNTAGMDQKHIKLVATSGGSHGGKKRKHSMSIP